MSWFNKRKERNLIPPVESENPGSTSDSYSSRSATSGTPSSDSVRDRYHRNNAVDVYSRGQGNLDTDRRELFSGYNPEKATGRFAHDGPTLREPAPGEENEEDVEGIKQQTRFVKQDSVNSTRNALRMAREAEETARGTINRLGSQSEKLANTERHLDVAKGHSQRAEDRTDELKQLNRSIFRPVITFNKDAKRAAQEAKVLQRYEDERDEREKAMTDIRETQNRLGQASAYGSSREEEIGAGPNGRRSRTAAQQSLQKEQRKRYQFEATASDDELEDELDDNLDEISDVAKRLKALGSAMGQELDNQNNRIERIEEKTVNLDNKVFRNTERLKRIK
ncbi:protein transporter SEC9 [Lactarius psammicola]|nr:protein transporter SEC9 [Lactarius psammicola]